MLRGIGKTVGLALAVAVIAASGCKGKQGSGEGVGGSESGSRGADEGSIPSGKSIDDGTPSGASAESQVAPDEGEDVSGAQDDEAEGDDLLEIGQPVARLKQKKGAPVKYRDARKHFKNQEYDEAEALLDEILEEDDLFALAILLRARVHMEKDELAEVPPLLERLVAFNHIQYAPMFRRVAWLKPLRADDALWGPFEEKLDAYRVRYVEALTGPGAFFVQASFSKLEQTDRDGEPLDLSWRRGSLTWYSHDLDRFLVLGEFSDVAGYLHDRDGDAVTILRWQPQEDRSPGLIGTVLVHRLDLASASISPPIEIAGDVEMIRAVLDDEGNLLFTDALPGEEDFPPASSIDDEEETLDEEDDDEALDDEATVDDEDDDDESEDDGDEEEDPPGYLVPRVNWETRKVDAGTLPEDGDWAITITLGATDFPEPVSCEDAPDEDPPKARWRGVCAWIDPSTAFCWEPTKKGGTWHDLIVHEDGVERLLTPDESYLPLIQY